MKSSFVLQTTDCSLDLPQKSLEDQVSTIVNAADDLSLPFCQLELRQIFELNKSSSDGSDDTVSVALLEAIKAAVDNDRSNWSDLIAGLDTGLTRKVCSRCPHFAGVMTDSRVDPRTCRGRNIQCHSKSRENYIVSSQDI